MGTRRNGVAYESPDGRIVTVRPQGFEYVRFEREQADVPGGRFVVKRVRGVRRFEEEGLWSVVGVDDGGEQPVAELRLRGVAAIFLTRSEYVLVVSALAEVLPFDRPEARLS